jgi:tetratricopeptide (TPR) repeat protein
VVLAEQGRQQEALIALEYAARLSPDDVAVKQALADTHYNIGVKLDQQQRPAEAVASYRAAIRFDRNLSEAFTGLGVALAHLSNYEGALVMYQEALRLRPSSAVTRYDLAVSLAMIGRHADAIESCGAALRLRPDLHQAQTLLDNLQRLRPPDVRLAGLAALPLPSAPRPLAPGVVAR